MIVYNLETKCFINIKKIFSRCHLVVKNNIYFSKKKKLLAQLSINFFFFKEKYFKNKMHNLYILHDIVFLRIIHQKWYRNRYKYSRVYFFFFKEDREKPRSCRLNQHLQVAFRCTIYSDSRAESNRAGKKQRDISRAITKSSAFLAILRGNIEDATTRKFMAGTKESNIVVASEPMYLPPPPRLFPRGESKQRRSLVLEGETFL